MSARNILIYLAVVNNGDWQKIYNQITEHEPLDEKVVEATANKIKSKAVTILDDDYPEPLKTVYRPPFVVFYHGDLSLIKDKRKLLSVVGSRDISEYGLEATNYFVSSLAKKLVIVSGMAMGVDSAAHRACIAAGGKTVAILGCGINVCYPPDSLDVYDELRKHHLIISEYPNLTSPNPSRFPQRNRLIAGISDCLLIPEGKRNSGTSITATLAADHGSAICCVPTRYGENSLCNYLISYGATPVDCPDDVLYEMGFQNYEPIFKM